jgi:hypothetical protein
MSRDLENFSRVGCVYILLEGDTEACLLETAIFAMKEWQQRPNKRKR